MSGHCFIALDDGLFVFDGQTQYFSIHTYIYDFEMAEWTSVSLND